MIARAPVALQQLPEPGKGAANTAAVVVIERSLEKFSEQVADLFSVVWRPSGEDPVCTFSSVADTVESDEHGKWRR